VAQFLFFIFRYFWKPNEQRPALPWYFDHLKTKFDNSLIRYIEYKQSKEQKKQFDMKKKNREPLNL